MEERGRDTFGSTWGTILTTAGVAIGLGNIWRFPYMMGRFGGGGFLIVYVVVVLAFGVPALMCEWALGRHTRRGPMGAFEKAAMPAGRWWGTLLLFTIIMAAAYYVVILGWVLYFLAIFAFGDTSVPSQSIFDGLMGNLPIQFLSVWACVAMGCLALHRGVKSGIEKLSKLITPLFFALFLFLIIRVLSLEGAWDSLASYLTPQWGQLKDPKTILAALGQGMFSLSLGGTFMLIYGSYLRREENIPYGALWTAGLDVAAALMASLIIVPAVLVFGIDMASGPPLLFVVAPQIFQSMPLGKTLGAIFFFSVLLVAMLSLIGAYEVIVGGLRDAWGWSRTKALWFILITQTALILPPMLSVTYITYSDLVWGTTMQPLGAALAVVALTWYVGRTRTLEEIGRNSRLPVSGFLYAWIKYVVPIGVLTGLIYGWLG